MQFWKQDMAQSADTESKEEAEQLLVRNSCKLLSVHSKQLRYSNCTSFYPIFTDFRHFYPKLTLFSVSRCNDS